MPLLLFYVLILLSIRRKQPMLDLQTYNDLSIPIKWTDGTLIKVNQPTLKFMKKVTSIDESNIDGMADAVLELLNNNSSSREFTKKDVESLNVKQFMAITEEVIYFKEQVDSDPN